MSWEETKKPELTSDGGGERRAIRSFQVWGGVTPFQVVSNPTSVLGGVDNHGLPGYGSTFPGDPACTLQFYRTTGLSSTSFDAVAEYGTSPIEILPTPNLDYAWYGSFQTEVFEIPIGLIKAEKLQAVPIPPLPGQPDPPPVFTTYRSWEFTQFPVRHKNMRHTRKVKITGNLGEAIEAVQAQNDKLMRIFSTWYLFEAGDYRQLTRETFEITYSLQSDPGTRSLSIPAGFNPINPIAIPPATQHVIPPNLTLPDNYVRPPFCTVLGVSGPPDITEEPPLDWFILCPYEVSEPNGEGWRNLPGFTPP